MRVNSLSWFGIVRIGLVQMAIGAVVAMATSTLNRIMVVELALPALLPGLLVGIYHALQVSRPYWGYHADAGLRRTPWIVGGMAGLALGGCLATLGTILVPDSLVAGLCAVTAGFLLIGFGTGAAATSLLTLLATATTPLRRPAAAGIVWLMMIFGIAMTATLVGKALDPYTPQRLLKIVCAVCLASFGLAVLAIRGVERGIGPATPAIVAGNTFRVALAEIWSEPQSRRFAIFVFLSMIAYSMQDLILEPYAGHVFGYTPGQSTMLAGGQNGALLVGMVTVGVIGTGLGRGELRHWATAGCLGSAAALVAIALAGHAVSGRELLPPVLALGFANGIFAVASIGAMMQLAGAGSAGREGTRMGLWGAAQSVAVGAGGLIGAAGADAMRLLIDHLPLAYGTVFGAEAALFLVAARLAWRSIGAVP